MAARSPRRTAPYQIETSSPSVTSPTTAAPGATTTRAPNVGIARRYRSITARGNRPRSASTWASSSAASASGPVRAVTEFEIMAIACPLDTACSKKTNPRRALPRDEPQLAEATGRLLRDGVVAREAGVAEALAREVAGRAARRLDGLALDGLEEARQ